jgi:hypothetical protein
VTSQNYVLDDGSIDGNALALHNKKVIIEALKKFGVENAVAIYSGEGDEGQIADVVLTPESDAGLNSQVTVKAAVSEYETDSDTWKNLIIEREISVECAIQDLTEHLIIMNNHGEYENGNGGGGEVTIIVQTETVEHDHYDYIVTAEHDVNEF